jgi:hypothetical protein
MGSNPRWKKFERECARDMGTERIPVTGERDGADFATPMFRFQAKRRKDCLPKEVLEWLDRAQLATVAEGKDRISVVVIQRRGLNRGEAVVLLRWADWRDLHGPVGQVEDDHAVHGAEDTAQASTAGQPLETLLATELRDPAKAHRIRGNRAAR